MRKVRWCLALVVLAFLLGAGGYYIYTRFIATNFDFVVEGQVYRSAQPSPEQLAAWIDEYGLRTIITLRGDSPRTGFVDESAIARQHGAAMIEIGLPNTQMPESPALMRLAEVLETAEKPILIHCRDGADRTGLASVMARMAIGGKSYDRSREMMGLKFLHVDFLSGHVASVLTEYESYCHEQGTGTGGWKEFRDWIFHIYRQSYRYVSFDVPTQLSVRAEEEVDIKVRFVNRSGLTIPAGDPQRKIDLGLFWTGLDGEDLDLPTPDPVPLAHADIPPGGEQTLNVRFRAPGQAGQFVLHFDLQEPGPDETGTIPFHHYGSPPGACRVTITPADR